MEIVHLKKFAHGEIPEWKKAHMKKKYTQKYVSMAIRPNAHMKKIQMEIAHMKKRTYEIRSIGNNALI